MLEVRGICRDFGALRANDNVSLGVGKGEILGLIGPNGAGKSTLFNMIAGAIAPSSGTITFEEHDITGAAPEARCRMGIARTFQVVRSFDSMSVVDNVMVGALLRDTNPRAARQAACEVLEFVELESRAEVPAVELTSPEKRRLELARALATRPKLLLLDEVMAGLTPTEARRGVELVRRIRQSGVTVIMVEHVMEIVMPLVDRVVVLDLGRLIASGSAAEVTNDPKVIAAYFGERRHA
ncbi:MAG: ABC transporter ATP-binding protein [Acetobacteraceae bacterium]|nr:ABC transporter ATP-binding protein [Acetobacteraceae bacterium]